jgi:hypothetical protein
MVIAKAFLSLVAGFVVMAAIVVAATAVLKRIAPEWAESDQRLRPGYVFVNLGYWFLASAAGGYVTAWAAGSGLLRAVLGLAVVVLVMGAISALQQVFVPRVEARGRQPIWYQLVLVVIAPLGVLAGGLVRLRVMGVL